MKTNHKSILLHTIFSILMFNNLSANTPDQNTIYIKILKPLSVPKVTVTVPTPVRLIQNNTSQQTITKVQSTNPRVGFSKRVPPRYYDDIQTDKQNNNKNVSTFLESKILPISTIEKKLQDHGFSILAKYKVDKKGSVISIIFTNSDISGSAATKNRGFASTLRLLVNKNSKKISITNPIYIMKAFLQDDYNHKVATKILKNLNLAFEGLTDSKDKVKSLKLARYKYMNNMPYYEDMEIIASSTNSKLLQKARESKKIIYEHKLKNGSTIIGVKLSKRTSKFVKKIGYQNAGLLPYPILIENNKAKVLSPKYYIAVMYPLLNLTQFMSIASVPGAIIKDCNKIFR